VTCTSLSLIYRKLLTLSIGNCYGRCFRKFGCPPAFLTILQEFHNGRESDLFDVLVRVKQGCVLAPVIFNLFLVTVTLACRNGLPTNAGIPYAYRLDGSLFNMRRLKAETKISNDRIYELQYADNAAIPAHSTADLQSSLDTLSTASYKEDWSFVVCCH